jgi:hypothetical protein
MSAHPTVRSSRYAGAAIDFSPVTEADEYLHPIAPDAHFTSIETNLYGFNIPEADIQCNIYALWHGALGTMQMHIFVYRGARTLPHQLAADYFNEHLYLPAVQDIADYRLALGSCQVHFRTVEPLKDIRLEFVDEPRRFALDLRMRAAMPPVGRPGGKHFTQLMKTSGSLRLDAVDYRIDGFYVRDRSWSYLRPEEPEPSPPYRWMTGWTGSDSGFVVAWIDTGLLDGAEFGPDWNRRLDPEHARFSKWESGGKTPSLNLRSGWFAVDGRPRPVVSMEARSIVADDSRLRMKGIELDIEDVDGVVHRVRARTRSLMPKMYWQNLLTYMHFMDLECDGRAGHGDLMDTYSTHHVREFGL